MKNWNLGFSPIAPLLLLGKAVGSSRAESLASWRQGFKPSSFETLPCSVLQKCCAGNPGSASIEAQFRGREIKLISGSAGVVV